MIEPTEMSKRPPIRLIGYTSAEGNPCQFIVGRGVTEIRETMENGEYAHIAWVEVWNGKQLIARFCQNKLDNIFYGERQ